MSNPNPNHNSDQIDGQAGETGNTSMDRNSLRDVVEDKLTEDDGNGPIIDIDIHRTTSIDYVIEEDDFSNLPYPSAIGPTSSCPVIREQLTEKEKITPTPPPRPEEPEEMELDNNMIHWALELKQRKNDLDAHERRLVEFESLLPICKELREYGWENYGVAFIELINDVSMRQNIDLSEAIQKVTYLISEMSHGVKRISDIRKAY